MLVEAGNWMMQVGGGEAPVRWGGFARDCSAGARRAVVSLSVVESLPLIATAGQLQFVHLLSGPAMCNVSGNSMTKEKD